MDIQQEIQKILDFEKEKYGIDWLTFYNGDNSSDENIKKRFSEFDIDFDINHFRENPQYLLTCAERITGRRSASEEGSSVANFTFYNSKGENKLMIDYVQGLSGNDLKKYIVQLTQKLQMVQPDWDAMQISYTLVGIGISAIGGAWAKGTAIALKGGAKILKACAQGVSAIGGVAAVVAIVTIALAAILLPFLIFMNKTAEMLMLVLNRTDNNLQMESYFKHGKMVQYPEELIIEGSTSKTVSIVAGEEMEGGYEICNAGMVFVSKRDKALYGVEGALKFTFENNSTSFPNGVYLGFSVPLAQGKNAGFISWDSYNSPEDFFKKKYDKFGLNIQQKDSSKLIQCRIDKDGGGEPAMIAIIQDFKRK